MAWTAYLQDKMYGFKGTYSNFGQIFFIRKTTKS